MLWGARLLIIYVCKETLISWTKTEILQYNSISDKSTRIFMINVQIYFWDKSSKTFTAAGNWTCVFGATYPFIVFTELSGRFPNARNLYPGLNRIRTCTFQCSVIVPDLILKVWTLSLTNVFDNLPTPLTLCLLLFSYYKKKNSYCIFRLIHFRQIPILINTTRLRSNALSKHRRKHICTWRSVSNVD